VINKLYFNPSDKTVQENAFEALCQEQNYIGFYNLPNQDITPLLEYCHTIPDDIDTIAVIGIGGSSLGMLP